MKARIAVALAALFVSATAVAADAPRQVSSQQQTMMEKMAKAAMPGAQHALLTGMAGEWIYTSRFLMDPAQPWQEAQGTATITSLMDGRYIQELDSSQFNGMSYRGMAIFGFDNVSGRYVSSWIDNQGTGMMTCVGMADASGRVITWVGTMNDPVTGKPAKARLVTTLIDKDHHTFEMYGVPPGGKKEMKIMTIDYVRKQESAAH